MPWEDRIRTRHQPSHTPTTTPTTAPYRAITADSRTIIRRIWERWVPTARSIPNSWWRSVVDNASVLTMPSTAMTTLSASSA